MRKRKELAYEVYDPALTEKLAPLIGRKQRIGLVILFLVSTLGFGNWIAAGLGSILDFALDYMAPSRQANRAPAQAARNQVNALAGDRLVIGKTDGSLLANPGGGAFVALQSLGQDVASAPGVLAYRRDGSLWMMREGRESSLERPGILPSWSADGERFAFVERTAAGDVVSMIFDALQSDSQPAAVLTVPEIAAPPRFHPATGRLLIAERVSAAQTAFYTVDPGRCILGAQFCAESRRDVGTVNYAVNWADYHPGATAIAFSERERGGLYLLNSGDGSVEALPAIGFYARRPAFSPDGARISFLSDSGGVFVMDVRSGAVRGMPDAKASSIDWAE